MKEPHRVRIGAPRQKILLAAADLTRGPEFLVIQPDAQYIIQPGARTALGDALVIGGRLTITF